MGRVEDLLRNCPAHGDTPFVQRGKRWRCRKCAVEAVSRRRRKIKELLVQTNGGKCILCGYDKYIGALVFHHKDPTQKEFGLGQRGLTHSISRSQAEACKCLLVCVRCHYEIHAGLHPEYLDTLP